MGISGSWPPPLYAHYNLPLPTVPHDIPPARPLRFSIGLGIGIEEACLYPNQETRVIISFFVGIIKYLSKSERVRKFDCTVECLNTEMEVVLSIPIYVKLILHQLMKSF